MNQPSRWIRMRIPIYHSGERAALERSGATESLNGRTLYWYATHSKANLQESPVMGGYLEVEARIFKIKREEPIPLAHLQQDLFQRSNLEHPFHKGTVQMSEIEDGPEATILLGNEVGTKVGTTALDYGVLRVKWCVYHRSIMPKIPFDTKGMASQASAHVAKGWIGSSDRPLYRGLMLEVSNC